MSRLANNPKNPQFHVKNYLNSIKDELQNKIVLDIPAGDGVISEILLKIDAKVEAYDLFPEFFILKEIPCKRADINDKIPVIDSYADMLICVEGIEHFSDQLKAFKEFNRVLKNGANLLITTPSLTNLAAKLNYLLFESESITQMPPNEINDIWMPNDLNIKEYYYGHLFLIGLQKLRIISKLAGFNIKEIKYLRISRASLLLFPFLYPFILISSFYRYYRNLRKRKEIVKSVKINVYNEQLKININPKSLLYKHVFVIFEKEKAYNDVDFRLNRLVKRKEK